MPCNINMHFHKGDLKDRDNILTASGHACFGSLFSGDSGRVVTSLQKGRTLLSIEVEDVDFSDFHLSTIRAMSSKVKGISIVDGLPTLDLSVLTAQRVVYIARSFNMMNDLGRDRYNRVSQNLEELHSLGGLTLTQCFWGFSFYGYPDADRRNHAIFTYKYQSPKTLTVEEELDLVRRILTDDWKEKGKCADIIYKDLHKHNDRVRKKKEDSSLIRTTQADCLGEYSISGVQGHSLHDMMGSGSVSSTKRFRPITTIISHLRGE